MSRNTSASRLLTVDLKIDFIARNKGTPEPSKSESWPYIIPRSREGILRRNELEPSLSSISQISIGNNSRSSNNRVAAAFPSDSI